MDDRDRLAELRVARDRLAQLRAQDEAGQFADDRWATSRRGRQVRDAIREQRAEITRLERELESTDDT